jgi:FkbM family methyltransferase
MARLLRWFIWRTSLEQLSHPLVFRRRLPDRFNRVPLYVSPGSALRYWHRSLDKVDRTLLDWAEHLVEPGSVVWDVGANVGLFTFAAAAISGRKGRVLGIEPDGWLVSLLARSRSLPGERAPVDILAAAIADEVAIDELRIAKRARSANYMAKSARPDGSAIGTQTGGTRGGVLVLTVTLDWLLERYEAPALVKLDVEGSEHLVLRGATRLLERARPKIICEVPDERADEFVGTLQQVNYRFFDIDKPRQVSDWPHTDRPAFNTLALPN